MKKYTSITIFVIIGILVMLIGAFLGWYVVLRMRGETINWQDAARGFGIPVPSAGVNGSNADNIGIGGGGGGSGFSAGGATGSENGEFSVGTGDSGGSGSGGGTSGDVSGNGTSAGGTNSSGTTGTGSSTIPVIVYKTPRLWHITKTPVAGFEFATGSPSLYFAERASGYIFRADAVSGEVLRRTNTLMPKTYEAILMHDGSALYRNIHEVSGAVQTFSGVISASSTANLGALVGVNLRNNILTIDADPDSKNIFYITQSDTGSFVGITAPWVAGKTGKEKEIFSSHIASWKPLVLADGRLFVTQKAHDAVPGYTYEVRSDGRLVPIVRSAPGLTFLPLSGTDRFIFGTSDGSMLTLYGQTATTTLTLPIRTTADKCVWSPYHAATKKNPATDVVVYCAVPQNAGVRNFLENWYMGALHSTDSWWRVNMTARKAEPIFQSDGQLDVVDPVIDPSGSMLAFRNGVDGTLWVLRIAK